MVLFVSFAQKRENCCYYTEKKKPKPSEKASEEDVLLWADSAVSYACLPSSLPTATSGSTVLPL